MKPTLRSTLRFGAVTAVIAMLGSSVSCTTTYDAYGRPVQSVTPGGAAAGVAAAGLLGYAVGKERNDNDHHHHGPRGYYDRYGRWHRY